MKMWFTMLAGAGTHSSEGRETAFPPFSSFPPLLYPLLFLWTMPSQFELIFFELQALHNLYFCLLFHPQTSAIIYLGGLNSLCSIY